MKNFKFQILAGRVAIACFCAVLTGSCQNGNGGQEPAKVEKEHLLLIAQRPTPEGYPAVIINNIAHIESQPFDGMFLNSISGWNIMKGKPVSYDTICSEFAVLKGAFKKFRHNFIYVFNNLPGDFWDDKAWAITAQNFANIAKVAEELGFKGVVFDNEEYSKNKWSDFGGSYQNPKYDLNQHRDQVMLRGKQIQEAMAAIYPNIEVMVYHGAYMSEPNYKIPTVMPIEWNNDSWKFNELIGPFVVGMMLGEGEHSKVIDGGELYHLRSVEDFRTSYAKRKFEIASEETNSWFIPYQLRTCWPNKIDIAFGVYNILWYPRYPINPEIMKTTLINALRTTDKYVWYYTEQDSWLRPGEMPKEWIDAVKQARNETRN